MTPRPDPAARSRRHLWLAGLAVACAIASCGAPPADGRPADARPAARLRLATWNIESLHRFDHEGHLPRVAQDYARLEGYARRLDADVVALQEVDGAPAARRVFDPGIYRFHFTADEGNLQRTGFAFRKELKVTLHPDVTGLAIGGTRRGADMTVHLPGADLRLLSLHLKSGCWGEPLTADSPACRILRDQLPALERWIDARARGEIAFAVLGDFNRRFERPDAFWPEIDDAEPPDADLTDAGGGRRSRCWGGRHASFIDHIVLGRRAAAWLAPHSFEQLLYDEQDARHMRTLSDHCPLAILLGGAAGTAVAAAGDADFTVPAAGAAQHAGRTVTVCGAVASARYARDTPGRPTFLNLDRPHPDHVFTIVIWGAERPAFGEPEVAYAGRRICVTGIVRMHRGRPQIIAERPDQIRLENESAPPGPR